jgi:hypothetical protein
MAGQYAAETSVSSEKSRMEIERILRKYGADEDEFGYATNSRRAQIQFSKGGRMVRFVVPLPDRNAREFTLTPTGRQRTRAQADLAYEQAVRQRWRALALVIKAKLEAVEAGISVFEEEFLANILLPGGQTVYEATRDGIELAYVTGAPAPLIQIGAS